jgi:multidrug efflux pump subunit AcrA (membrane-fusion protein)
MSKVVLILVVLCAGTPIIAGCADSSAEQAGGPKKAAKAVKTEAVRQESVRRSLDVVGTLAAEDQVTISSEVDGVVRRIRADLGDRVAAGQSLVELDREKLQYSLTSSARPMRDHPLRCHRCGAPAAQTPDAASRRQLAQAKQSKGARVAKRQLIPQQSSTTRRRRCA